MEDFIFNENYKKVKKIKKRKNTKVEIINDIFYKKDKRTIGKEYRLNTYDKNKDLINERRREKRSKDINFQMAEKLRGILYTTLKNNFNSKKLNSIIGCTIEKFKEHFASKFQIGMSWDIFFETDLIHIDHIIPCSSFDLTKIEQQELCFHYTNIRPLWWWQNISKGNRETWTSIGSLFNRKVD